MDIDNLEGYELDAAVAEAMGWVRVSQQTWNPTDGEVWRWRLVDPDSAKISIEDGWREAIAGDVPFAGDDGYRWLYLVPRIDESCCWKLLLEMMSAEPRNNLVQFCNGDGDSYDIYSMRGDIHMSVDTEQEIPTMICRAWLKWKEAIDGR